MRVVVPWRVRTILDEKDWLILAYHPHVAIAKHLRRVHRIQAKTKRDEIVAASPPARELKPYWVVDEAAPERRAAVYATDVADALRMSLDAGFTENEDRLVLATDHIWPLMALTEDDLIRAATYIWTDNSKGGIRHRMVPAVWRRTGTRDRERRQGMSLYARLSVAFALRVAMLVPELGGKVSPGFLPPGDARPSTNDVPKRRRTHAGNISAELTEEMLRRFGPNIRPWDPSSTELLVNFVEAYGYDPHEMKWPEVAALWEGGPAGLEAARLDSALGMHDWFGHGIKRRQP